MPGSAQCGQRLLRREPDGSLKGCGHADLSGLPSGFNEITVDGGENVYVNGADFDFLSFIDRAMKDMAAGDTTPLHHRSDFVPGYIALITPDGVAREVAGDIAFPNGMVVGPDNRTLIISELFTGMLTAFDIGDDGGLGKPAGVGGTGSARTGAAWTPTARCGRHKGERDCVRVAEGGAILDRVELGPGIVRVHARRAGRTDAVRDGRRVEPGPIPSVAAPGRC